MSHISNDPVAPASKADINSRALKAVIILLAVLLLVPSASARNYALEEAEVNITVDPDGIVHVEESISYVFEGNYSEIYRNIRVMPGGSIRNIEGSFKGEACDFSVKTIPEGYELRGKLPDPTPEKVTFLVSYDHCGAVKVHRDVSEFHYKLWGDEWEKPLGSLKGSIKFPVENENELQYWIHPDGYTQEENVKNNVINVRTKRLPPNRWYEIRAVFPRIASPNSSLVIVDDEKTLSKITFIEDVYEKKIWIIGKFYRLTVVFALLTLIFPFAIYFRYGRESKIDYQAIYEREPPTDSKPAIVNAIMFWNIGFPTMHGFTATVMDLANLGYISLRTAKSEEKGTLELSKHKVEDILIELSNHDTNPPSKETQGDLPELEDFERDVLNLLKDHASGTTVSWNRMKKDLGKGKDFYHFVHAWNEKVKRHIIVDEFFQSRGNTYIGKFGKYTLIAAIVFSIVRALFFPLGTFPLALIIQILLVLIGAFGFFMLIFINIFKKVMGRWTPEGKLYYMRWKNFRKYLIDFSALKEHPPESIKLWDSYLVYATAMGIAELVLKNMSLIVPSEQLNDSCFDSLHDNYSQFGSGLESAYSSSNPSSDGSGGGAGGVGDGSGGGGGGAD
ncbi:DUF2207 domain-containing protein [Methanosarcina sp. Mfa9]|uniref:DUF2207 domain-containing protein n=1 Tax=Methanosarcina sp. Mfa9 TaxID=3439063 RepID=UPI003F82A58D